MKQSEATKNICTLPNVFTATRHKSLLTVAKHLNLKQCRKLVDHNQINSYLIENPELIEVWLNWSEDKRYTPAWWFGPRGAIWIVGNYPDGPEFVFKDRVEACCKFIEIEVDLLLSRLSW
jgi:hypothetical protein